jgi:hypothetical protein
MKAQLQASTRRYALLAAALLALSACSADAPQATTPEAPANAGKAEATPEAPAPTDAKAPLAGSFQACMIAGEFKIMGRTIRSRDCMRAPRSQDQAMFRQQCTTLAETSGKIGNGKPGTVDSLEDCPRPSQGSCLGMAGGRQDGFYYERDAEGLAGLPESCTAMGGRWEAVP